MAERQAAQARLQHAQEKAAAEQRTTAWRTARAGARRTGQRRERLQRKRQAMGAVSWGLLTASFVAVTVVLGLHHGLRTGAVMALISVILLTLCVLFDRRVQPHLQARLRRFADRMDARMERRLAERRQRRTR